MVDAWLPKILFETAFSMRRLESVYIEMSSSKFIDATPWSSPPFFFFPFVILFFEYWNKSEEDSVLEKLRWMWNFGFLEKWR